MNELTRYEMCSAGGLTAMAETDDGEFVKYDDYRQATTELVETLMGMIDQHCTTGDGKLDSCALSTNAEAMYILAKYDLIEIEVDVGRRVIAKHKQQLSVSETKEQDDE